MDSSPLKELFRLDSELPMTEASLSNFDARSTDLSIVAAPPRILIVEDDEDIARLIAMHLEDLNAELIHSIRGDHALALARDETWNLIVLDLRLPGIGGLDICRRLREHGSITPILMLTAKSSELDRVLGLELGADD
ncbi:response regulator [Congregibacter sp.]|uniref:response regulator n=1 Tax=Congregibacter sp. TaxID=2744308 RepID=UPI003F6CCC9A